MGSSGPDLNPQRGIANQLQGLANSQGLQNMAQGQLNPFEQQMYQQQLQAVQQGQSGAAQQIQDTTRSEATSRGLFSSQGAIANEANQLANLPLQQSQQLAQIYGNQANLSRQGMLQGIGLQSQLLGQALGGQANIAQQQNQQENQLGQTIGGIGGAAGGIFCFLGDVKIKMRDGSLKEVRDIELDDDVLEGGRVLATGVSKVPEIIYEYNGVRVSGGHPVFEHGTWVRVYKSKHSKKLFESNEKRYPIVTEKHILITSDNQVWADYSETDQGFEVTDAQRLESLNNDTPRNAYLMTFKKEVAHGAV